MTVKDVGNTGRYLIFARSLRKTYVECELLTPSFQYRRTKDATDIVIRAATEVEFYKPTSTKVLAFISFAILGFGLRLTYC